MKTKFLLLIFVFGFLIVAKSQDTRSIFQQDIDYFLQYLDKSQIPTGILYDRVAQLADLDTLSNIINNNTNPGIKTSYNHFLQAWQELYNASYDQSNILKPEWLDAFITQKRIADIIPIGVLNYRFNILDSLSLQNNLLYQTADTMLHDVQGRTQLPYINKEIFLATPLIAHVSPGAVTFQFALNTLLQNNSNTVSSLAIDFGEGQTATLMPDGSVTVQIQQTGRRTLVISANFSDGTQKTIRAILEVDATGGGGTSSRLTEETLFCVSKKMQANIPFADYNTGENKKGEIDAGYYFANCADQTLRKPIIILDGFDPGDGRRIPGIYDLLTYTNSSGNRVNFGNEMRQSGYDVIIVNFPNVFEGYFQPSPWYNPVPIYRDGGADYMERNAMVIVKLIDSINTVLQNNGSSEKIILKKCRSQHFAVSEGKGLLDEQLKELKNPSLGQRTYRMVSVMLYFILKHKQKSTPNA